MTDADAGGADGTPEAEASSDADPDAPAEEASSDEGDRQADDGSPADLVARVAAHDEAAAAEVAALRERVDELESALADRDEAVETLESKLKRARADFQNYKRRASEREASIRERATEDLVERLLDVRDNLVRAVEQDDDVEVRDGVEATLATFDRVLDAENVSAIEPDAGEGVEPSRHEVVHREPSGEPEGAIADVYRPGYEMAGKVLRPAQVTVSEGAGEPAKGAADPDGEGTDDPEASADDTGSDASTEG